MILATHVITGASIASLVPEHPAVGFIAGFVSHFILDSIPHWEYKIPPSLVGHEGVGKMKFDRELILGLLRIFLDLFFGLIIAFLIFFWTKGFSVSIFCGIIGAILPDILTAVSRYLKFEPFFSIDRFHHFIHSPKKMEDWYFWGPVMQVAIVFVFVFVAKML